jgi:hypothetical protein
MGAQGRSPDQGRLAAIVALLRQADIQPGKRTSVQGVNVVEATVPGLGPQSLVVHESQDEGMQIGLKVAFPADSALANQKPSSEQVLVALGAIAVGLSPLGLRADLLTGADGTRGILIVAHICEAKDPAVIRAKLATLRSIGIRIAEALVASGPDLLRAIRASLGIRGFTQKWQASGREAVVVPTFDTAERDRMMRETGVASRS